MKSTVSTRGQVSIPAVIRKKYHIEAETVLDWIEDGDRISVIPLPKDPVGAFRGAGKGRYTSDKLVKDRRQERLEEEARDRKS
jgi:AbrB family looped-hinge helix DNA binding protein